jgi:lipopolysaccharide export system permease protein
LNGFARGGTIFFLYVLDPALIIFRYLCKEVLGSLLATTLVLLIILMSNQFVHYLNVAANGSITMATVMKVMSLQVPLLLGFLLPLGLFIGIMLAFGRLYVDQEMTVLSACGVSRGQLLRMALLFATAVALVVAILMLWAEPKIQWYRTQIIQQAMATASLDKVLPGRFQSIGKNGAWTFFSEGVSDDHQTMHHVFLAKPKPVTVKGASPGWDIVTADTAHEKKNPTTHDTFLVFNKGYRTLGAAGSNKFQITKYDQYGVRLLAGKPDVGVDVKFLSTSTLWRMHKTSKDADAELQWRMAMPISVWLFTLIAVPLSYTRPRHGRYLQLLPAILIYILYADLMFVGRAWIEQGTVSTSLGLWWLHALVFLIGALLVFRFIYGHCRWMPSWLQVN